MNNVTGIDTVRVADIQPNKFSIDLLAETIAEGISTGQVEPLQVAVKMTAIESLVKAVREKIQGAVIDELGKYPKGKAEILGASVSQMESVKYDYSHIDGWQDLDEQIRELTERRKAIEDEEKKYRRG